MPQRSKWSLIGIPDHLGVLHSGGRIGAARGPLAFRRAFSVLKGADGVHSTMQDAGDAHPVTGDVGANIETAARLVESAHRVSRFSIVVGGGHDHGYSQLLGVHRALGGGSRKFRLGCLNLDAHLDLRKPEPRITSGSPFHLAIESGILDPKHLVEMGIQPQCNSEDLWAYAAEKKIKVVPFEDLRSGHALGRFEGALKKLSAACDAVVVSLDLDSVAEAFAPGVSAPQSEGFTPSDVFHMMERAGESASVASLGIFELNPEHDSGDRTARLAATAAYRFTSRALRR